MARSFQGFQTEHHRVFSYLHYIEVLQCVTLIIADLTANLISPATGGLNGGSLITVIGFGFNIDTVIEVNEKSGGRICEFCRIHSIPSASELIFYSPRVLKAQTVDVKVKHEYLSTTIPVLEFVYTDSSAVIQSFSADVNDALDLNDIEGGENVVILGTDFGTCANIQIDVVLANDPCAIGQHECEPTRAHCTPTSDLGVRTKKWKFDKINMVKNSSQRYFYISF